MPATIYLDSKSVVGCQRDLVALGHRIQSFREPLERSVREVMVPEISANFATQGHGTWPALAQRTTDDKAKLGFPSRMLVRTKKMITAATQLNAWSYGGRDSATFELSRLPDYSGRHIEGTNKMPQRDFTAVSEAVATKVEIVFADWLQERIDRFYASV